MRHSETMALGSTATPRFRSADRRAAADEVDFGELWSIMRRRKLYLLGGLFLFLLPAMIYIVISPTLYGATTSILVDPRQGRSLSVDTATSLSADTGLLESQLKIVMSQTVLRRVVQNEDLIDDPEFGVERPGLVSRLIALIRRPKEAGPVDKLDIAVDALSKNMTVRRSERTYVIDITVSSQDAQKSARLANAVAKAYLDDASDARGDVVKLEGDYVRQRLQQLQREMQDAEEQVARFKQKNQIFDASGKLVNDEQITNLTNEIIKARARTSEARARLEQVRAAERSGRNIETLADGTRLPVLDRLRTQAAEIARVEANLRTTLGPRHPQLLEVQQQAADTRRLIMAELRRLAGAAENEYQVASRSESGLEAELQRLRSLSDRMNLAMPQLRELERNVDAQRAAFDKLSKAGDTISQQGADTPVARIIAVALVPMAPSSPRKIPILALAGTAGLGFGIGAGLLAESLARRRAATHAAGSDDGSSRDPRENDRAPQDPSPAERMRLARWAVWLRAKAARLGRVGRRDRMVGADEASEPAATRRERDEAAGQGPNVERPDLAEPGASLLSVPLLPQEAGVPYEAVLAAPGTPFAGAIFSLAARLLEPIAADNAGVPRFIFVTSIDAEVGKSILTANLAAAIAAAGARVLAIDAHADRPQLSEYAAGAGQLGLLHVLGRLRPAFALERKGAAYHVLSAADADPATLDRLQRAGTPFFPGDVDRHFDIVLIDGPAIHRALGADALVAAADRVLLVGGADVGETAVLSMAAQALRCPTSTIEPVAVAWLDRHAPA